MCLCRCVGVIVDAFCVPGCGGVCLSVCVCVCVCVCDAKWSISVERVRGRCGLVSEPVKDCGWHMFVVSYVCVCLCAPGEGLWTCMRGWTEGAVSVRMRARAAHPAETRLCTLVACVNPGAT